MDDASLSENLTLQHQEIDMLKAMYPGPKEIEWDDPTQLIDLEEFVNSGHNRIPSHMRSLSFTINLDISSHGDPEQKFSVRVPILLPQQYPHVAPQVSVMCDQLTRCQQSELNENLRGFVAGLCLGDMMLMEIVAWIQDNVALFQFEQNNLTTTTTNMIEPYDAKPESLTSMWLYMHHIYNPEKRKNIVNWANDLGLTGFSLPGKPGVVHVEGAASNVEEFFERLRRLTWKRMSCKVKEPREGGRLFERFEELVFGAHGGRDYHMDLGKFFVYLKGMGLGYMFKELFGVDGHD